MGELTHIALKCPQGHTRSVGIEYAGKKVVCDQCGHVWEIPALPAPAAAEQPEPEPGEARPLRPSRRHRRSSSEERVHRRSSGDLHREPPSGSSGRLGTGLLLVVLIAVLGWIAYHEYGRSQVETSAEELGRKGKEAERRERAAAAQAAAAADARGVEAEASAAERDALERERARKRSGANLTEAEERAARDAAELERLRQREGR